MEEMLLAHGGLKLVHSVGSIEDVNPKEDPRLSRRNQAGVSVEEAMKRPAFRSLKASTPMLQRPTLMFILDTPYASDPLGMVPPLPFRVKMSFAEDLKLALDGESIIRQDFLSQE